MKIKALAIMLVVALAASFSAQAQFKFGLKAGVALNKLKFTDKTLEEVKETLFGSENCAGFVGGVMVEFGLPISGLAIAGSLLYAHRRKDFDYIDIPLNLKYKFPIPIVKPFICTGPDFAFRVNQLTDVAGLWKERRFDFAWNIGFGVELFNHLQAQAAYSFGLTKVVEYLPGNPEIPQGAGVNNRYWTITLAYLF